MPLPYRSHLSELPTTKLQALMAPRLMPYRDYDLWNRIHPNKDTDRRSQQNLRYTIRVQPAPSVPPVQTVSTSRFL